MRIEWKDEALNTFRSIAEWYGENMGEQAKRKFINGILDATDSLEGNPRMGVRILTDEFPMDEVRAFVEHKRHRIVYYIEADTVFIADIWSTAMNHKFSLTK